MDAPFYVLPLYLFILFALPVLVSATICIVASWRLPRVSWRVGIVLGLFVGVACVLGNYQGWAPFSILPAASNWLIEPLGRWENELVYWIALVILMSETPALASVVAVGGMALWSSDPMKFQDQSGRRSIATGVLWSVGVGILLHLLTHSFCSVFGWMLPSVIQSLLCFTFVRDMELGVWLQLTAWVSVGVVLVVAWRFSHSQSFRSQWYGL